MKEPNHMSCDDTMLTCMDFTTRWTSRAIVSICLKMEGQSVLLKESWGCANSLLSRDKYSSGAEYIIWIQSARSFLILYQNISSLSLVFSMQTGRGLGEPLLVTADNAGLYCPMVWLRIRRLCMLKHVRHWNNDITYSPSQIKNIHVNPPIKQPCLFQTYLNLVRTGTYILYHNALLKNFSYPMQIFKKMPPSLNTTTSTHTHPWICFLALESRQIFS